MRKIVDRRRFGSGEGWRQLALDRSVLGAACEICPFIRIGVVVVQFLGAISNGGFELILANTRRVARADWVWSLFCGGEIFVTWLMLIQPPQKKTPDPFALSSWFG